MANLTISEKQKLERLFKMESGYVLNFSDRTFPEFVLESTGLDIDEAKYRENGNSKAKRLRTFWKIESNAIVGKLIGDLIEYSEETGSQAEACRLVAARLLGGMSGPTNPTTQPHENDLKLQERSRTLRELKDAFFELAAETDRRRAGFALERLLNRLFEIYELEPRKPFRVTGEQIDGSFQLDGEIYLLESKWEKDPLPEADLLVFRGKIEGKSTFTRGVMIALNDVTEPARDAITRGKAPSFFIINGYDLKMILSETITLPDFLRKRVRLLGEEGRVTVHFHDLQKTL